MFAKIYKSDSDRIMRNFEAHFDAHLEDGNYRLAAKVFIIAMKDFRVSAAEYRLDQRRKKLEKQIADYNFACEIQSTINSL